MPTINHAPAILRWRQSVEAQQGGLGAFQQSSTISTMLFGCQSWLQTQAATSSQDEVAAIEEIKSELENWMGERGLTFTG